MNHITFTKQTLHRGKETLTSSESKMKSHSLRNNITVDETQEIKEVREEILELFEFFFSPNISKEEKDILVDHLLALFEKEHMDLLIGNDKIAEYLEKVLDDEVYQDQVSFKLIDASEGGNLAASHIINTWIQKQRTLNPKRDSYGSVHTKKILAEIEGMDLTKISLDEGGLLSSHGLDQVLSMYEARENCAGLLKLCAFYYTYSNEGSDIRKVAYSGLMHNIFSFTEVLNEIHTISDLMGLLKDMMHISDISSMQVGGMNNQKIRSVFRNAAGKQIQELLLTVANELQYHPLLLERSEKELLSIKNFLAQERFQHRRPQKYLSEMMYTLFEATYNKHRAKQIQNTSFLTSTKVLKDHFHEVEKKILERGQSKDGINFLEIEERQKEIFNKKEYFKVFSERKTLNTKDMELAHKLGGITSIKIIPTKSEGHAYVDFVFNDKVLPCILQHTGMLALAENVSVDAKTFRESRTIAENTTLSKELMLLFTSLLYTSLELWNIQHISGYELGDASVLKQAENMFEEVANLNLISTLTFQTSEGRSFRPDVEKLFTLLKAKKNVQQDLAKFKNNNEGHSLATMDTSSLVEGIITRREQLKLLSFEGKKRSEEKMDKLENELTSLELYKQIVERVIQHAHERTAEGEEDALKNFLDTLLHVKYQLVQKRKVNVDHAVAIAYDELVEMRLLEGEERSRLYLAQVLETLGALLPRLPQESHLLTFDAFEDLTDWLMALKKLGMKEKVEHSDFEEGIFNNYLQTKHGLYDETFVTLPRVEKTLELFERLRQYFIQVSEQYKFAGALKQSEKEHLDRKMFLVQRYMKFFVSGGREAIHFTSSIAARTQSLAENKSASTEKVAQLNMLIQREATGETITSHFANKVDNLVHMSSVVHPSQFVELLQMLSKYDSTSLEELYLSAQLKYKFSVDNFGDFKGVFRQVQRYLETSMVPVDQLTYVELYQKVLVPFFSERSSTEEECRYLADEFLYALVSLYLYTESKTLYSPALNQYFLTDTQKFFKNKKAAFTLSELDQIGRKL